MTAVDNIMIERIKLLHPDIRNEDLEIYKYINNKLLGKNIRLRFSSTFRTDEEQKELYAKGRSIKGKKVTNAKPWQSIHNYGLALDIVILFDKDNNGVFETASWNIKADNDKDGKADWMEVVSYFKDSGWKWGGDWKSFPDYPHFEKTFGHTWKTLKAKIDTGDFLTETINDKIYKWVNL